MEILIHELHKAIECKLYNIALNIALTIPDICGALESENGKASGEKYKTWFDKYCSPKFNNFVNGNDIYQIRCATSHQGKLNHDSETRTYKKIIFQIPDERAIILHNIIMDNAINFHIIKFINAIIDGYNDWYEKEKRNQNVIKNLSETIKFYPNGLAPYIVGLPLIT